MKEIVKSEIRKTCLKWIRFVGLSKEEEEAIAFAFRTNLSIY